MQSAAYLGGEAAQRARHILLPPTHPPHVSITYLGIATMRKYL